MLVVWLVIIIASAIVEFVTVNLVSIWFTIGGVAALIAQMLGVSSTIQIILFIALSIICLIITRPLAKKYLKTNIVSTNYDRMIGKHGLVTKTIDADTNGEVKVMSTTWMACSVDNSTINEGDYCEILAIEGAHLVVKKIER